MVREQTAVKTINSQDSGFDDLVTSWLDDEEQARSICHFWILTNRAIRGKSGQLRSTVRKGRLKLVSSLHPRRVWLYLRMMRIFTDRPLGMWPASRDAFLHNMVAGDNGGPEDVVVECMSSPARGLDIQSCIYPGFKTDKMCNTGMSAFYLHGISRAMMRASGMRQYYELCTGRGHSPSREERFAAAMDFVGSIADCDLIRIKEAAIDIGRDSNAVAVMAHAVASGRNATIAHELWMRYRLHQEFGRILSGTDLQGGTIQELKELVFQLLYPLQPND